MKNKLLSTAQILLMWGFLITMFHSCEFGETGLPRSSGSINELLIVTDSKVQWEGELGDSLRAFFARNQVGLPQPEPVFDLINIASKDLGDLYQKYHNIFIAEINPNASNTSFDVQRNVWSDPQRVIRIAAPELKSFLTEFDLKKDSITKVLVQLERQRTLLLDAMSYDIKVAEAVRNKFSISLSVPGGFYIAKETPDLMWLRHKITKAKQDIELGILIYTSDSPDSVIYHPKHIITWRNTITREHVPGPSPGSFMVVSQDYIPPVFTSSYDFPSGYAIETRGIWAVQNDFMGGAFVSYTFIHPVTQKAMTLDGYVYNPNNDKKDFIRHLESMFWAVKF
jgi:hypothetical protein